ncbi:MULTISPECIES: type II toxin-antitoxin system death-on-curing family toxin [unclassified Microcoleus]|uniref:type II toxin-antitoxin system death-on-curing family toxin n=1 Tax=unclassified Microcoleus TaxID=2642155 RepID=UPI002FD2DAC2
MESAFAQPQATFGGNFLHPTISEQAAAYLYHIPMNHPFIDGNKRSAFAVTDTFLRLNNCALNLTDDRAYDLVMRVARGTMTKEELSTEFASCIV